MPSHPNEILRSGDIYLKSIDRSYRRSYRAFLTTERSPDRNEINNKKSVQELYVSNEYIISFVYFIRHFNRTNIFKIIN